MDRKIEIHLDMNHTKLDCIDFLENLKFYFTANKE